MPETVGSMVVTYSVTVDQAIKNLDRYNASITKNEDKFKKQSKTEAEGMKKSAGMMKTMSVGMVAAATAVTAAFAAVTAGLLLVVGGIYGVIKASSYGAIYVKQFGVITQQIANTIMEKTGLNNVLADATRAFQLFADTFEETGFLTALWELLKGLNEWIANHILTPFRDAGAAVGRFFLVLKEKSAWEAIKGLILEFSGWIWDKVIWLFPKASQAFVDFINKLKETDWTQLAIDTFGKIYDWIKTNILDVAYGWGETLGAKIREGLNSLIDIVSAIIPDNIVEAIKTLIGKAWQFGVDIANKIKDGLKSVVLSVTVSVKKIIGSIFGGSSESKEPDTYQMGGMVEKTGLALVHAGEYVVPKAGALVTAAGGDNNPIINNIEIINNSASVSGKLVDDPANVNTTSIEEIKNNLQSVVDWIQINVIDKSANWGIQTIINMKEGILSDGMFPHIIPNRIIVGIDNLISLSYSMGLNVITEFKGGINELLDDTTAIIPIGMTTAFQQIVDSSYNYGVNIAKEIQRGLSSVRLSVTVYKRIVTTSSGGGAPSKQFGGPIKETGLNLLHAGEYVVPKAGTLVGGKSGGDTYNIAPIINITTSGGSGMASDISRQVSKAIAEEVRRITKV